MDFGLLVEIVWVFEEFFFGGKGGRGVEERGYSWLVESAECLYIHRLYFFQLGIKKITGEFVSFRAVIRRNFYAMADILV